MWHCHCTTRSQAAYGDLCDRPPGGFDDAHLALSKLLPVLALVSEIRVKNRLAANAAGDLCRVACRELILAGATGVEAGRRYAPPS